ncbi:MAG: type I DNA topoisomerase [Erysipelotrichaceae bacterium]|nr:type I DNA topoisomerase [Erysipelotrichaceae bacterium]
MKNLVIVESPAKSKTIEKYLGSEYKVVSSKGHIRDLATTGKEGLGVDVDNDFAPTYKISKDKKDVVKELTKDVEECDFVYLATDPDREGEAISWHLAQVLELPLDKNNRIVFNEITKNAVTEALKNPREIDMNLVKSQETRRILDRVIGFKLSKLLQKKIHSKSAGRVQSIALRMICDREKEVEAFVPEEYWTIKAKLKGDLEANLTKIDGAKAEIKNEEEANKILEACDKKLELVVISEKAKNRSSYLPFITSTLQQEASTKLGYSAKRTMSVAQGLYEGVKLKDETVGLITYMRSDSTRLSKEFVAAAFDKIEKEYGQEYKGVYRVKNDENTQDAHEAIRPTYLTNDPESVKPYLTSEQYKVYKLIYCRALASLMADAKTKTTAYSFKSNNLGFTSSGTVVTFDGFLKVYKDYDSSKDVTLPSLKVGDKIDVKEINKEQHFTEGPSRFTEAKLIKALEEEGVGRPSTYASIIETIIWRNYVELKRASESSKTKYFFPTDQGKLTDQKLKEYFSSIINVKYTAQMEEGLDEIADGKKESVAYLRKFYDELTPLVLDAYEKMEVIPYEKVGEPCPECGGDLLIRFGRFGKFISCSNFPKCKYTSALNAKDKEKPEEVGKNCPECGNPLVKRKSRFGTYFVGCSTYPKCNYMETLDGEKIEPKFKRYAKKDSKSTKKTTKKTTKKATTKKTKKKTEE